MEDNNEKFKFSGMKKYLGAGLTALLVIIASLAVFFFVLKIDWVKSVTDKIWDILNPFVIGLIIAYLLNPLVKIFDRLLAKPVERFNSRKGGKRGVRFKFKIKSTRGISVALALIAGLLIVSALISMVVPELIKSIMNMLSDLPSMMERAFIKINEWTEADPTMSAVVTELYNQITSWMNTATADITATLQQINNVTGMFDKFSSVMNMVAVSVRSTFSFIFDLLVGIIISIYVLAGREKFIGQTKKFLYAFLPAKAVRSIVDTVRESNRVFGGFIIGKLIDSLIIGILCFIGMSIMRIPYVVLISVIVGVTNIIPFFGPYIGAIPSIILILLANPIKALYFAIFIIILQQVDGNIIGPKILGDRTGLTPFWVVFAIMVGGGIFGFAGMIVGVPATAVILDLIRRAADKRLEKKNMPVSSEEFTELDEIDEQGNAVYFTETEEHK